MRQLLSTLCVACALLRVLLLMPTGTAAQPHTLNSDREQHSVIREVDAYTHLSENMTLAEVRKAAFATAKQQALEGAQTHIQANTMMKNGQIEYDIVVVEGEGMVRVLEQKDLGVEDN